MYVLCLAFFCVKGLNIILLRFHHVEVCGGSLFSSLCSILLYEDITVYLIQSH